MTREDSLTFRNVNALKGIVGLYFIYNSRIEIRYPVRKSRLIYIGMSEKITNSIGKRLQEHLQGTSDNQGIKGYAKVNDLLFTYFNFEMLKSTWKLSITDLESYFILDFVKHYGVYSICNNKSGPEIQWDELDCNLIVDWKYFE